MTAMPEPEGSMDQGPRPIQVGGALLMAASAQDHHAMWLLTEEHAPDECIDGLLALSKALADELARERGTTRAPILQSLLIEAANTGE